MAFTYDLTTDIGLLRLKIPDHATPTDPLFQDEELQAFLTMNNDSLNWALVGIYETLCALENSTNGDEIKIGDIRVNGGKQKANNYCRLASDLRKGIIEGTIDGNVSPFYYCGDVFQADRTSNEQSIADNTYVEQVFTDKTFDNNYDNDC